MVRIRRALKIFQMARDATGNGKVVVIVDVAVRALPRRNRVHSRQRKSCRVVIEGSIEPRRRVMTLLAGLREVSRNMVRIGCAPKILQVAAYARSAGQVVVIVDVAVRALAWRPSRA